MHNLRVGDRVRWLHAVTLPEKFNAEGTITAIITSDSGEAAFDLFDVQFAFGNETLYGTQIDRIVNSQSTTAGG